MSKASRTGMAKAIQIVNTNIVERGQVDLTLSKEHPWNPSPLLGFNRRATLYFLVQVGRRKKVDLSELVKVLDYGIFGPTHIGK